MKNLDSYVKTIPDFPKEGVLFRDVTGILESPDGFQLVLDRATETAGIIFASPSIDISNEVLAKLGYEK